MDKPPTFQPLGQPMTALNGIIVSIQGPAGKGPKKSRNIGINQWKSIIFWASKDLLSEANFWHLPRI